jgi:hypothetical protein
VPRGRTAHPTTRCGLPSRARYASAPARYAPPLAPPSAERANGAPRRPRTCAAVAARPRAACRRPGSDGSHLRDCRPSSRLARSNLKRAIRTQVREDACPDRRPATATRLPASRLHGGVGGAGTDDARLRRQPMRRGGTADWPSEKVNTVIRCGRPRDEATLDVARRSGCESVAHSTSLIMPVELPGSRSSTPVNCFRGQLARSSAFE